MVTRLSKTRIHTDTSVAFQGPVNYAAASGTDTYTADPSPAFTAYVTGAHYFISFTNGNTSTTPTLNLNSLGAKTIVKEGTAALSSGDIPAGHKGILMYDGTYLVILNPKASSRTPTIQVFTSSGTWTKPAGVTKIRVRVVGGGGGGGAAITNNGSSGETSSFGAYCSATGGAGGATNGVAGGSGGAGSGGSINFVGGSGGAGTNNGHGTGGTGGNSIFGAGGYSTRVEGGTAGGNGGVYGGGGGGAGGSNGVSNNGAGGGAGGASILFLDVTSVSSVSVTVGGGGAGGAPGHLAGGNGGAGVVIVEEY